jgi:protease-4
VLSGKPVLSDLLGRAGVTTDSVTEGAHSGMFATTRPFSEEEWALVNDWLDHIYADFTGKVATGRRMSADRVHELARGRACPRPRRCESTPGRRRWTGCAR